MLRTTMACVAAVVRVPQHAILLPRRGCACRKLKGFGTTSPSCTSSPVVSIEEARMRGGVPVLRRPILKPTRRRVSASTVAGSSPARPAATRSLPQCMTPRRKVPVVITTRCVRTCHGAATPSLSAAAPIFTPRTLPRSHMSMSSTLPSAISRLGNACISRSIASLYSSRSICARGPRTAGPLEAFRMRKCMPAKSAIRAITPPSASISRTRCPLPTPPMDGLHDMVPKSRNLCVSSSVFAPILAAAAAASHPACPPPTTTTSHAEPTKPCRSERSSCCGLRSLMPLRARRPSYTCRNTRGGLCAAKATSPLISKNNFFFECKTKKAARQVGFAHWRDGGSPISATYVTHVLKMLEASRNAFAFCRCN